MGLLDVDQQTREVGLAFQAGAEGGAVLLEDVADDPVGGGLIDLRVAARLVDDHQPAGLEVLVNVCRVIRVRLGRVLRPDPADGLRAVGVVEHLQQTLEVIVGPVALVRFNVILVELHIAGRAVGDEVAQRLARLLQRRPRRGRLLQHRCGNGVRGLILAGRAPQRVAELLAEQPVHLRHQPRRRLQAGLVQQRAVDQHPPAVPREGRPVGRVRRVEPHVSEVRHELRGIPGEGGIDDLLADLNVIVHKEVQQHQHPAGVVRVGRDAVGDHVALERLPLGRRHGGRGGGPDVLDCAGIGTAVRVLRVLIGIFAVGVEHELPDPPRRLSLPPKGEDGLKDDLRRVALARAGHAEEGGLLAQQVGRRDAHVHVGGALKGAVGGGVADVADLHRPRTAGLVRARVAVVDDLPERRPGRLVDLQAAIGVVIAQVRPERQPIRVGPPAAQVVDVKGADHAAADAGEAEKVGGGRVHDAAVVPVLVHLAADALGVFHPHPRGLGGVGQVRRVQHPQEKHRRILLTKVERLVGNQARGDQERQRRDAADLLTVVVVDLHHGLVVANGEELADVAGGIDQTGELFGGGWRRGRFPALAQLAGDRRNNVSHACTPGRVRHLYPNAGRTKAENSRDLHPPPV